MELALALSVSAHMRCLKLFFPSVERSSVCASRTQEIKIIYAL